MKYLLPILLCTSMFLPARAQFEVQYLHEAGVGAAFSDLATFPMLQYSPRLNIYRFTSSTALSLDARIGVGYAMEAGTYVQDKYPVLYVPGTLNFNVGACATRTSDAPFGYYFGGGYGYENAWENYIVHGPVLTGGVRMYIGGEPFDAHLSYLIDITNQKSSIIGLGVHWVLNMLK